jgi:hypothetical protein
LVSPVRQSSVDSLGLSESERSIDKADSPELSIVLRAFESSFDDHASRRLARTNLIRQGGCVVRFDHLAGQVGSLLSTGTLKLPSLMAVRFACIGPTAAAGTSSASKTMSLPPIFIMEKGL